MWTNDEHNQNLINNVHPPDWKNPQPAPKYHLVVIGAGTAGLVAAAGAAGLGAKVALIENKLMGGDCLNWGCVPSKSVIRSSRIWADLHQAQRFGFHTDSNGHFDFPAVMERMRKIRTHISHHDSAQRFQNLGVDVFFGEAHFESPDTVVIDDTKLHFQKAVIATGTRASIPPIKGLDTIDYLTNESVFTLTEQPKRLLVIGAGPIGVELAQAFQRFGSEVTIVEFASRILPKEDPDVSQFLATIFQQEGIKLQLNSSLIKIQSDHNEKIAVIQKENTTESIPFDQILIAVGRKPNVENLNLDRVGVDYDPKTGIKVNDYFQTTNRTIYAAGDVCMKFQFTHAADASARIVIRNALFPFLPKQKMSSLIIPWCTYTDPEIAHVGLNETTAKHEGTEIDTLIHKFEDVHRALIDGEDEGFIKIHVKKGSDQIVGATIVARNAGDMLNEITLAMNQKIGLGKIASVIHPYPTQAECIKQTADAYNRTRLTPRLKKFFQWWFR